MEFKDEISKKINKLLDDAEEDLQLCEFDKAIKKYVQALDLLEGDIEAYDISTTIYASMGDAMYLAGDYNKAKNYFYDAMNCPGGIANPYLLFRLGQCFYKCDNIEKSKEYFIRTYMIDGVTLFNTGDKKYFNVIKEMIK